MKNRDVLFLAFLFLLSVGYSQITAGPSTFVDDVGGPGAQNAVKKAHQMTDLEFDPVNTIIANKSKTYQPKQHAKGLVYSSVLETSTFVGMDVSFHTFMTALRNPKSVVYTEHLDQYPYHGTRIGTYYGTNCSGLVSYALGLKAYLTTYDIPESIEMMLIEDQSAKGIQLADVLWQDGHVALVTGIRRNKTTGEIVRIEISEAWRSGCRRRVEEGESAFNKMLADGAWKIYRYKHLENNGYKPWTEFVAVEGEKRTPFQYNDAICPNKGDKACYITGDNVILNISDGYKSIEIYKDEELYQRFRVGDDRDIVLRDLPYGDYKARLVKRRGKSDFAYWKVVDVQVNVNDGKVSFHSENATPVYLEFCTISGSKPVWAWYVFSEKDLSNGFVKISKLSLSKRLEKKSENMYVKIHFECNYGRVVNRPVLWNKNNRPSND